MSRLLIDAEVLTILESLPARVRGALWQRIRAIGAAPQRFAEYQEKMPEGREVDVNVCGLFAIYFWDDFADRHVKILALRLADR